MIAQYLEWQIRRVLTHLLFEGDDPEGTRANSNATVQKAQPSESAKKQIRNENHARGLPVHPTTDLLSQLGSPTLNELSLRSRPEPPVYNRLTE